MLNVNKADLSHHHVPVSFSDRAAAAIARSLGCLAATLFSRRYGDRVIVLETIAAVPGMVAATLLHLKCLRRMIDDHGWVRTFMDEAENQRAHLMAFVAIRKPSRLERLLIVAAQGIFYNAYFLLHLCSPRTAHRLTGYLAEAAVRGYTFYLQRIESGQEENAPAPPPAVAYWGLESSARLSDMISAIREDEAIYRDINHVFADALAAGNALPHHVSRESGFGNIGLR